MKIRSEELAKEIEKYLNEFTDEVEIALEGTKTDLAKQAVKELKSTSPKDKKGSARKGTYAKSWTKSKKGKKIIVHNKEYQLTHLLEKGHAKVNGGRVPAQEHIGPVEKSVQDSAEQVFRKRMK